MRDGTDLLSLSTTTSLLLEMFLLFYISLKFQIAVGFCYLWECEKYAVMIMFALIEIDMVVASDGTNLKVEHLKIISAFHHQH